MDDGEYSDDYPRALARAAVWHRDQTRKVSGVPYVSHLLTVSALVLEDGGSETEAIAALFHDAVEDRKATLATIEQEFGPHVAEIVDHCTDAAPGEHLSRGPWFSRKAAHIERLRTLATKGAAPTMRVVGADKLANIRSILVDASRRGPSSWDRFKGGLGGNVWYYGSVAAVISDAIGDSMIAGELSLALVGLEAEMERLGHDFGGADRRIAAVLGDAARTDAVDATDHLGFELARALATQPDAASAVTTVMARWFGVGSNDAAVIAAADAVIETRP